MSLFTYLTSRRRRLAQVAVAAALSLAAGGLADSYATAAPDAAADTPRPTASPGPITSEPLAEGDTDRPFTVDADGPRKLVYRKATIPPGASTGWHYHEGEEIAVIVSGTLTRINGEDCSVRVLKPGDALVEPTGPDEVHFGVNKGNEPVVLYITDVLPEGAGYSKPAPDPGCETAR
jgi:quercetin dioxygenase-like cupin family protein